MSSRNSTNRQKRDPRRGRFLLTEVKIAPGFIYTFWQQATFRILFALKSAQHLLETRVSSYHGYLGEGINGFEELVLHEWVLHFIPCASNTKTDRAKRIGSMFPAVEQVVGRLSS